MKESKIKKIIFCQGDKKELEEITGQKYEYMKLEDIQEEVNEGVEFGEYATTFIYNYDWDGMPGPTTHLGMLEKLRKRALQVGADAVIHYVSKIYPDDLMEFTGYARGTPVRKKS